MSYYDKYKVDIPEGVSGDWRVERFIVSEEDAALERMRMFSFSSHGRGVPVGTYTRLMRGGQVVMSDTPDEIRDQLGFINRACGEVLINGLGLGVTLQAALEKEEVERVTVVEISNDVISLVAPYFQATYKPWQLNIVCADALEWTPPKGRRYGAVWNDIWDDICSDNLPEMHKLHRKYGRRADWVGSWCRAQCERYR